MNRTWARAHLRQKGASLHGFVYVYDEWPFNWLPMLERNDCIDPITYASTKACGDLRMAAQLLRKSHPWRTNDPSKARLFYVPALLGLSIWTTPFAKMFTGTNGSCIEKRGKRGTNGSDGDKVWTFAKLVDTLYDALKKTPFFGKRPHLFVSGSFSTPYSYFADRFRNEPKILMAHTEVDWKWTPFAKVYAPTQGGCTPTQLESAAKASRGGGGGGASALRRRARLARRDIPADPLLLPRPD